MLRELDAARFRKNPPMYKRRYQPVEEPVPDGLPAWAIRQARSR